MKKNHFFTTFVISLLLISACKKNPIDKLTNPLPDGDVPLSSGIYVVYDDELKTGGGLSFVPGGENQSIDLSDQSSPQRTTNAIRYVWNGKDVTNGGTPQHLFAGFQLIVSPDSVSLDSTPARDLSAAGYTQLTFYLRGSLSLNTALRIEGPDDGNSLTTPSQVDLTSISSDWTKITLSVPSGDFSSIKSFVRITFQYTQPAFTTNPGEGGVVYLDDIQYER